ncbi:MAG: NADH-quinone oxidoreductase subunit NuoE [Nitrospirae bacterium]|nr:NADH-quinone oxidoreductase subunit NuoE [Nitrospirota bacterium]
MDNKILDEINELKRKYEDERSCLLPALYLFQREYGWLSPEALERVAEILNIPKATVKGVSTFYAMFSHKPMGRHLIQLCTNVACMIMGGERLLDILKGRYGLEPNLTTPDRRFSLVIMECIGACDTAPAMLVDTDLHGNLTEENIIGILERYE